MGAALAPWEGRVDPRRSPSSRRDDRSLALMGRTRIAPEKTRPRFLRCLRTPMPGRRLETRLGERGHRPRRAPRPAWIRASESPTCVRVSSPAVSGYMESPHTRAGLEHGCCGALNGPVLLGELPGRSLLSECRPRSIRAAAAAQTHPRRRRSAARALGRSPLTTHALQREEARPANRSSR